MHILQIGASKVYTKGVSMKDGEVQSNGGVYICMLECGFALAALT